MMSPKYVVMTTYLQFTYDFEISREDNFFSRLFHISRIFADIYRIYK